MKHATIQQLYLGARAGNTNDEKEFFRLLHERFLAFAEFKTGNSPAAPDIVQTALMTVADKYRSADIMDDIAPWAHRILLNHIMHYYRAHGRKTDREIHMSETCADQQVSSPDPLLKLKLRECLKKLHAANARHARILNLRYQGYSTEEITDKLAMSRNAFYISLSRARTMLQECLDKGDIPHE